MSLTSGSTIPLTPDSFSDDVTNINEDGIFAWLRPLNQTACEAYDATVNTTIKHPVKFKHIRQFLHADTRLKRAGSTYTEDGDVANEPGPFIENLQWTGAFKFSLMTLPYSPGRGWYVGTNRGQSPDGVAGKHARLSFHRESCRIVLEARHTVTIGRNGATTFTQSASRVLEQGELISIGNCVYTFEYADLFTTSMFEKNLCQFMKEYYGSQWSLNRLLSPTSVGKPISLGNYYCSPGAFAQGTFGKVTAGWTREGAAVAIKQFKKSQESEVRSHQQMMRYFGNHDNILPLLDCVGHFNTKIPDAYCVYAPLAVASLADMISAYQPDFPAKLTLLTDYLNGLSYLHDQKSVMHRDINPSNLAVVSFGNPKGIILDLDSATPSPTSTDHMKGTLQYLAPEIMDWKNWNNVGQQPAPYGKSVDVWALGLSMFALYHGQPLRWASLVPRAEAPSTVSATVTRELHTEFHRRVRLRRASCLDPQAARFLEWIEQMTEYFPGDRISASEVLDLVLEAPKDRGKGSIVLKTGLKRPLEE